MSTHLYFLRLLLCLFVTTLLWWQGMVLAENMSSENNSRIDLSISAAAATDTKFSQEDFVGAAVCAECHAKQYQSWQRSAHANAGGLPSTQNIIPSFSGSLQFSDAEVKLEKRAEIDYGFSVKTPAGETFHYSVDAVVGGGRIAAGGAQSYFTQLADGTLRYLPFDYSTSAATWFCQTQQGWQPINENLSIHQCLSWPPELLLGQHVNFDRGCLDCHGSQIQLTFDAQQGRYQTSFQSLNINCESCHGAGKRHLSLARNGKPTKAGDSGMRDLAMLDKQASVEVCLQCHGLKTPVNHGDASLIMASFTDRYALFTSLSAKTGSLLATGQIRDFSYQEQHLFSACYLRGTLTCTNCHSPHDQSYRDVAGNKLASSLDDRQCTGCHASEGQDSHKHSHHSPGSPGDRCVACHMPSFQQPGVAEHVPYARADHTIAIPRPALASQLGVNDACGLCHKDKSSTELDRILDTWYGSRKPLATPIQIQIQAQQRGATAQALLNNNTSLPAAQLANLSLFIERYLSVDMTIFPEDWLAGLKQLVMNGDLDLKATALMALHLSQGESPVVRDYLRKQLDLLAANDTAVRHRWTYTLLVVGDGYRAKGDLQSAQRCYEKVLELEPNYARVLTNLGGIAGQQGKLDEALDHFKRAIAADPDYVHAYFNMAVALSRQGHEKEAQAAMALGEQRRGVLIQRKDH